MQRSAAVEVNKSIQYVYDELGPHMNERAYSRAIQAELQCRGFLVDSERPVNTWFTTSSGQVHLIGPDRCDLLARHTTQNPIVIELKVRKPTASDAAQLRRYIKAFSKELKVPIAGVLVYLLADNVVIKWADE